MDRLQVKVCLSCPRCNADILLTEQINANNEAKGLCVELIENEN